MGVSHARTDQQRPSPVEQILEGGSRSEGAPPCAASSTQAAQVKDMSQHAEALPARWRCILRWTEYQERSVQGSVREQIPAGHAVLCWAGDPLSGHPSPFVRSSASHYGLVSSGPPGFERGGFPARLRQPQLRASLVLRGVHQADVIRSALSWAGQGWDAVHIQIEWDEGYVSRVFNCD